MKSFGLTDKGMVREDNQDSFIIEKVKTKDCLGTACLRCQMQCPQKVYKYDLLTMDQSS